MEALFEQTLYSVRQHPGATSAYRLTLLKLSQSARPEKIKERVGDLVLIGRIVWPVPIDPAGTGLKP
ncbi:MAG: hypothetical protein IPO71_05365 [Nitrosomonas sp.]|nr:hypothetical protein [Nitrosomonas sp.]